MADAQYRPDIDGLRGLAVAAVVVFHAFPRWLPGGFLGVDVFFVISGFLISSLVLGALDGKRFSLAGFYARRIRRLFPALVLVLAASIVAGWYLLPTGEFRRLGAHTATASVFLANVAFWRETGYFDAAAESRPLLHLWSLGVEEQFYLTWPIMLALAVRGRLPVAALTAALLAASFAASVVQAQTDAAASFYLPHTRAWELLAGALVAMYLRRARLDGAASRWAGVAGLACIVVAAAAITRDTVFPAGWALAPVAGTCLVIAGGVHGAVSRLLTHRTLVWLGLVSYPLYLWHWPILSFARQALVEPPSALLRLGLVALAVVLAAATKSIVEQPVRFGRLSRSAAAVAVLVVSAGAAGMAGAAAAEGLIPGRPTTLDRILANEYDYRSGYRGRRCQLASGQGVEEFAGECIDAGFGQPGTRSVLVWGDSHAAHLYPGLRSLAAESGVALAQYTADACSPVFELCEPLNRFVLSRLAEIRPDVIVLAADWEYAHVERLPATIARIRRTSDAAIVVVGPVPQWPVSLPQVLTRHAHEHPDAPAPSRLDGAADARLRGLDAAIGRAVAGERVSHVSALDALCDASGCLAIIGDRVTAFDSAHLTDVGSRVVASAVLAGAGLP